ncbi:universal stress protein [Dactylosporangium cerinum]
MYVYEFAWPGAMYEGVAPPLADEAEQHADRLVADMVRDLRTMTPGLDAVGTAIRGAPAQTLLYLSDQARLLVVGNQGGGGFTDLLLGSVSQQVSTHAHGPVAVVRGRTDATDGPVVVGVDGSDSTNQALGLAFEAAVARGTELVVIRTYAPSTPPGRIDHSPVVIPPDVIEAEERRPARRVGRLVRQVPVGQGRGAAGAGTRGRGAHRSVEDRATDGRRQPWPRRLRRTTPDAPRSMPGRPPAAHPPVSCGCASGGIRLSSGRHGGGTRAGGLAQVLLTRCDDQSGVPSGARPLAGGPRSSVW